MNVPAPAASRIAAIALNVVDIGASRAFYEQALGFMPLAPGAECPDPASLSSWPAARHVVLALGPSRLQLTQGTEDSTAYPADSRANDLWFQHFAIRTPDLAATVRRLRRYPIADITQGGPQTLPPASGGVTAYKFRDPDGHPLELLAAPRTGIDHTALSVADAGGTVTFYRDLLGLRLGHEQLNKGPAQERLDGLAGSEVRVVTLWPAGNGPHLELLEYQHPRPRAAVIKATDIAATRTVWDVSDLDPVLETLGAAGVPVRALVMARPMRAVLLQDPYGHWLAIREGPQKTQC